MLGRIGERTKSAVKSFLPRGGSLPYEQWERRHRVIVALLWVHAVGLTIFGLIRGYSVPHIVADTSVIATAACGLAKQPGLTIVPPSDAEALSLAIRDVLAHA